jgi:hypothetical protein
MAVPVPAAEAAHQVIHAESSLPLRPGHMDDAFEELDEVPRDGDPAPGVDGPPVRGGNAS